MQNVVIGFAYTEKKHMVPKSVVFILVCIGALGVGAGAQEGLFERHQIPVAWRARILEKNEILVSSDLERADSKGLRRYRFQVLMQVKAPLSLTAKTITRYDLYPKMISYIDRVDFDSKTNTAEVEGGLWGFKLQSRIRFEIRGEERVDFEVVSGHFRGMQGAFEFEAVSPRETLVLCYGSLAGSQWPPTVIMETGAAMVMDFVAQKMKRFTESRNQPVLMPGPRKDQNHDEPSVPTPRRRL